MEHYTGTALEVAGWDRAKDYHEAGGIVKREVFLTGIRKHIAVTAIGPSAVRGQGAPGVARAARAFLSTLPLSDFSSQGQPTFRATLDRATIQLARALPRAAQSWGLARKCLNLFLRDALYNIYLSAAYRLRDSEAWLEIPLDGVVAQQLRAKAGRGVLPTWPGVRHLDPVVSDVFQGFALTLARAERLERVHLDSFLWVEGRSGQ